MAQFKPGKNPSETVLVITIGFILLHVFFDWQWPLIAALVVGIAGILSSRLSKIMDFAWMKLAWFLGLIIPNILLTIIFYFALTPIAFLSKIFGEKDPLSLKNNKNSLFKERVKAFNKKDFEKPW